MTSLARSSRLVSLSATIARTARLQLGADQDGLRLERDTEDVAHPVSYGPGQSEEVRRRGLSPIRQGKRMFGRQARRPRCAVPLVETGAGDQPGRRRLDEALGRRSTAALLGETPVVRDGE